MKTAFAIVLVLAAAAAGMNVLGVLIADWERPPLDAEQIGYRGLAMEQVVNPRTEMALKAENEVPEPPYEIDQEEEDSTRASEVYENVQVLGDISQERFDRLMAAMTEWVSPEEGCNYCHNPENLADDDIYTKVVSRRMIQMTQHVNDDWGNHVGATGVTCYTCHRGQPVPAEIWFKEPGPPQARGMAGYRADQNVASEAVGLTSLPYDPFTPLLQDDEEIRVIAQTALPAGEGQDIKMTESTYALMMHFSTGLGVNCTHCHNSRSFFAWDQSTPQRTTAWHGIRMVRGLNNEYLEPLGPVYPPHRLGPLGDAPKAHCATCHQGVNKPLYGFPMLKDYPSLGGPDQTAQSTPTQ